jgi:hypothetical protein
MATLQRLGAVDTRIADLSPLAACPGLEHLVIAGSPVSDLRPLARLKLRDLDLARTAVTDLTPLAGKRLPGLDLADTPLSDVRLIPEDALTASGKLVLGSAVVDLSPLAGRRLGEIGLSGFRGASLEPLRQVQADSVLLRGIGRQDISPLFDMSGLHYARVFASDVAGTQIDALADLLAGRGMREQDVRCLRAQAALADRDWRRLRELARPAGRALRLKLGIHLGLAEARRLAAEAGAHLPCLVDEADRQALADLMAGGIIFWIGLDHDAGQPDGLRWDDGHPDPRPRRWLQRGVRPQDAAGFNLFSTFGGHQLGMVGRRELESARLDVVLEWPLAP